MSFDPNTPTTPASLLASGFCLKAEPNTKSLDDIVGSLFTERFLQDRATEKHNFIYRSASFLLRVNCIETQEDLRDHVLYHEWYVPSKRSIRSNDDLYLLHWLELRSFINFAIDLSRITAAASTYGYKISDNASLASLTTWFESVKHFHNFD